MVFLLLFAERLFVPFTTAGQITARDLIADDVLMVCLVLARYEELVEVIFYLEGQLDELALLLSAAFKVA